MSRPRQGLLLAALLAPALASCVALLDFDELSAGSGGATGLGGSDTGSAGEGGSSGGAAGAGASTEAGAAGSGQGGAPDCGDCTDDDPCTVDSCGVVDGEPSCLHEYALGLALDGVDETVVADVHHRVTMVGGPDAFFYSVFSENAGQRDLALYRLGADEAASELIAALSDLPAIDLPGAGRAVSAAGLAIDDDVAFRLHAFVGIQDAVGGGARPWHVIFQGDPLEASTALPVGDSYDPLTPTNYPAALNITGTVYGAWITETHTIELSGLGATNTTFAASTPATTLSLFDTTDNEPAVLYTGSGTGVYLESVAAIQTVTECETRPGFFLSSQTVPTGIQGFHFASWTKTSNDFLVSESQIVACGADGCFADMTCDGGGSNNPVRNTAGVTAKLPGAPPGEVHYVLAVPYLAPGTDPDAVDAVDAGLSLQFVRINFGPDPLAGSPTIEEIGEAREVVRMPTDASFAGPDWPAIAYVEPDKVALAWLQPGDAGDELRVQRYQMCLGE